MLGKANSEVTPAFAVSLQKPQGSVTVAFCSSYLTLHTQRCGKERFPAMRSPCASWVKHFLKILLPNQQSVRLVKKLSSRSFCMITGIGWSHAVKQWEKPESLFLALILYYTWGTTYSGLGQSEAVLDLAGITASIWYITLHHPMFCKSLSPKQFQDTV